MLSVLHFLSFPNPCDIHVVQVATFLSLHIIYFTDCTSCSLSCRRTEHTPSPKVCNKVNDMHLLCESPNWGNPRGKQKVSMLKIKVRSATPRHISHPVTRAFLIDATISNVTVPVNHTEVLEHWLFFTQDASVSFWGELYKGQTVSPWHTLGQDSTWRLFTQSCFVNLKENSGIFKPDFMFFVFGQVNDSA